MSNSDHEAESSTKSLEKQPRKRAPPFTRAELIFIVDYMEKREYGVGERGTINSNKGSILQDLRQELEEKFGVDRLERQIQKRYSDLRTREKDTYDGILRKIAKGKATEQIAPNTSSAPVMTAAENVPLGNTGNEMQISGGDEFITLTLETIPTDPITETSQPANFGLNFEEKLLAMEGRLKEHLQQNLAIISQKMDDMCSNLEQRIMQLEQGGFN
ncbi:uncharacterized protein LOC130284402 [Hyla sarda]|uniref:uncharacterized protein LOC130284402 n=1 Tax=Hyla sarda TaxID=327740 RepID=UPI0024C3F7FC|nr:uncharacterized protein LOC130284402 [Hyla sarda]